MPPTWPSALCSHHLIKVLTAPSRVPPSTQLIVLLNPLFNRLPGSMSIAKKKTRGREICLPGFGDSLPALGTFFPGLDPFVAADPASAQWFVRSASPSGSSELRSTWASGDFYQIFIFSSNFPTCHICSKLSEKQTFKEDGNNFSFPAFFFFKMTKTFEMDVLCYLAVNQLQRTFATSAPQWHFESYLGLDPIFQRLI